MHAKAFDATYSIWPEVTSRVAQGAVDVGALRMFYAWDAGLYPHEAMRLMCVSNHDMNHELTEDERYGHAARLPRHPRRRSASISRSGGRRGRSGGSGILPATIQSDRESWLPDVAATPHPPGVGEGATARSDGDGHERAEPERVPHARGARVTADLYAGPRARPTVSFEIFPPRTPAAADALWATVGRLAEACPDYISVTYGASGGTRDSSRGLVSRILRETAVEPVAHLTCVVGSRAEVGALVGEFLDEGVRSILALRGDPPTGQSDWRPHPDGLLYASDLVALIRHIEADRALALRIREPNADDGAASSLSSPAPLSIAVAAYPGETASPTRSRDVAALLAKQEAGADYAITQLFYDPAAYAGLVHDARAAGVHIPIVPGLIPMTDHARLQRLAHLTGVRPPEALLARLEAAQDPVERHRIGIRATVDLAHAVLDAGAPGLHIYTFNRHEAALDLLEGVHLDGGALLAPDLASGPWVSAPPTQEAQGHR